MKILQLFTLLLLMSCNQVKTEKPTIAKQDSTLDSIHISIEKKGDIETSLGYFDDFDNLYPLYKGKNSVPSNVILQDLKSRTFYFLPFCSSKDITFSMDSAGYWIAKTPNIEDDNVLNFFIRRYETVKPINTEMQMFTMTEYWDKKYLKNPRQRDTLIDSDFERSFKFLSEYASKNKLSENRRLSFQKIMEYEKVKMKLSVPFIEQWDKSYLSELAEKNTIQFQNDDHFYIPHYKLGARHLNYLINFLSDSKDLKNSYKNISDKFSGKTKDYLLTQLLIASKKPRADLKYAFDDYKTVLNQYRTDCKTEDYKNYVEDANIDFSAVKKGEVMSTTKQALDFDKLIKQNKLTYIDFWASWCMPCRAEMPASLLLKEEYAKKGINFIYISADDDAGAWLKAMKQIGLSDADNYLLPKGKKSELAKQLNVRTLPHYILTDKNGKIINADAPRPTDAAIRKQFDILLAKY